jgi:hypothetical protein
LLFAARDAELKQLKALVEQLADKVNARGDTPAERLAAVEHRVDEVATHGVRLGTTLGLAAMATHTDVDYSTRVLITRVVGCEPARSICNVVFVLRTMHLGTGHFLCL